MAKTELMTMAGVAPWQLDFTKVEERCEYLLRYVYTGKTHVCSLNLAWELWYAAKKYQLPHLVEECKKYIRSVVDPKNACKAYEMARFLEDKSLMDLCIEQITSNTKEAINNSSSFDDVEWNTVITVCSLEPLNVDSELDLFYALARYAEAQERTQEQSITSSVGVGVQVNFSDLEVKRCPTAGPPSPTAGLPSPTGPPSENLSLSPESPAPEEKVIRNIHYVEIENNAQNTVGTVELDSKSIDDSDTEVQSEPEEKKKVQEVPEKPNIRAAVQKIRFLSLTPQQFADGPARSTLLSKEESFAILVNITSEVGEVPMPAGFSNIRERRKQPYSSSPVPPVAPPVAAPATAASRRVNIYR